MGEGSTPKESESCYQGSGVQGKQHPTLGAPCVPGDTCSAQRSLWPQGLPASGGVSARTVEVGLLQQNFGGPNPWA